MRGAVCRGINRMFKKYLLNTSGNFSIIFSVAVSVLLFGVGAAIDFSGATSQKTNIQAMSDAAVLAAVSSKEDKLPELKKIVTESLAANNPEGLILDWDLKIDGDDVTLVVNSVYDTHLMGFVGKDKMDVSVLSAAKFPEDIPINIALVLDRTGSMAGSNMTALQAASEVLIDQFVSYDSDTRVAVVPFSNYVNVGLTRRNEKWIDVPPDGTINVPAGECYMRQPTVCTKTESVTRTYLSDGVLRTSTRDQCTASVNDGPEQEYCPPAYTKTITWNGCIGSRDGVYNQTAAYKGKRIPGIMDAECGEEVQTLTDDMDLVKSTINGLTATESTYIPTGLVNGWRMLDSDAPFDDLSNKDEKRKRALVLMTDGFNTLSLEDPYFTGEHTDAGDVDDANELTVTLCENIKAAGIDIWSVAYNFDGADTKTILRNCATSSSQFFDASDQAQLISAFENIGKSLFQVRLTR